MIGDEIIAVNAQQYAVLVMDVPNLAQGEQEAGAPCFGLSLTHLVCYLHAHVQAWPVTYTVCKWISLWRRIADLPSHAERCALIRAFCS